MKARDEYLECLWGMEERGETGLDRFLEALNQEEAYARVIEAMARDGLVEYDPGRNAISLTDDGRARAARIIRAHRIGERLLFDVFSGKNLEAGACEFEHTVTVELVDGLCTLLGHPRKCPHGNDIPEGNCCRAFDRTARYAVTGLGELAVGQRAKVAYIDCRDNRGLYRLNGFQVRPGAEIVLVQRKPCLVLECEGTSLAVDEAIADGIRVWATNQEQEGKARPAGASAPTGPLARLRRLFRGRPRLRQEEGARP